MRVYLSGPIFNVSREDSITWRDEAIQVFNEFGVEVSDPNERPYIPGDDVDALIEGDLNAIEGCDVIVSYIPLNTAMAGTPMEIFYAAYVLGIPVYTFPHNPSPWFLKWSTKSFATLDDLLDQFKKDFSSGSKFLQTVAE